MVGKRHKATENFLLNLLYIHGNLVAVNVAFLRI